MSDAATSSGTEIPSAGAADRAAHKAASGSSTGSSASSSAARSGTSPAEAGIRQFLNIGTGLPSAGNTHEVAQEAAPESRIVYVDYAQLLDFTKPMAVTLLAILHAIPDADDPHAIVAQL